MFCKKVFHLHFKERRIGRFWELSNDRASENVWERERKSNGWISKSAFVSFSLERTQTVSCPMHNLWSCTLCYLWEDRYASYSYLVIWIVWLDFGGKTNQLAPNGIHKNSSLLDARDTPLTHNMIFHGSHEIISVNFLQLQLTHSLPLSLTYSSCYRKLNLFFSLSLCLSLSLSHPLVLSSSLSLTNTYSTTLSLSLFLSLSYSLTHNLSFSHSQPLFRTLTLSQLLFSSSTLLILFLKSLDCLSILHLSYTFSLSRNPIFLGTPTHTFISTLPTYLPLSLSLPF